MKMPESSFMVVPVSQNADILKICKMKLGIGWILAEKVKKEI